jgi:UDP-3-O-[3-hydroxymyristoyl] glucosamine N-acyltransferase
MWARPQLLFEKVDFVTQIINSRRQRRSGSDQTCSREDLPLLDIGKDVHVSNRAALGTNIVASGMLLVDGITIGNKTFVGHLDILGAAVILEKNVELGVAAGIRNRSTLREKSKVLPCCDVEHGVMIGKDIEIGTASYVGTSTAIGDNLNIPYGALIPKEAKIMSNEDVALYVSSAGLIMGRKLLPMSR